MNKLFQKPFYKESGKWGIKKTSPYAWEFQPEHTFEAHRQALEAGNTEHFRSLKGANPSSKASCQLVYYSDPGGKSPDIYLTLANETISTDKKGKEIKRCKPFVRNVRLPLTAFQQLEAIAYDAAQRASEQL